MELAEARREVASKEAELVALQSQAAEFRELQDLLEGWETNTVSGTCFQQTTPTYGWDLALWRRYRTCTLK